MGSFDTIQVMREELVMLLKSILKDDMDEDTKIRIKDILWLIVDNASKVSKYETQYEYTECDVENCYTPCGTGTFCWHPPRLKKLTIHFK